MKAYFDSIEKEVPEELREVFLDRHDTAVITIDMHDGHLSTDPDCPCPSPRGREINTAFDAANRDFRVVVPRDLTRGSEHLEEPALRMISLHLGLVVDSDALLSEWRSQKE